MIKRSILLYVGFLALAVLLKSCCEENWRISGVYSFIAVDLEDTTANVEEAIDTIKNSFGLRIFCKKEITIAGNVQFINEAYAVSCKENKINRLAGAETQLYCNKTFTYAGATVDTLTNMLLLEDVEVITDELGTVKIDFGEEFMSKATFTEGDYIFKSFVSTDDSLTFEAKRKVYIKLN